MMKKAVKKLIPLLLVLVFMLGTVPQAAALTIPEFKIDITDKLTESEYGIYSGADVKVINKIIENNGLKWTQWTSGQTPPADWKSFYVSWNDASPKRITKLDIGMKNLTGTLDVSGLSALEDLDCGLNRDLTGLNVKGLTSLKKIICWTTGLKTLDVSGLTSLEIIWAFESQISSVNLSGATRLRDLDLELNPLVNINLKGLPNLEILNVSQSKLTQLDLDGLTKLKELGIGKSKLTELKINNLPNLESLFCRDNGFKKLTLTGAPGLKYLDCSKNSLTTLDLSATPNLQKLRCGDNLLTSLALTNTPNLILLDCSNNALTALDTSVTPKLEELHCTENTLTSLKVSGNKNLTHLHCFNNNLKALDLKGLNSLKFLRCSDNKITKLDVNGLSNLRIIDCGGNLLTSLDVSGLDQMWNVLCDDNNISDLKFSPNAKYYEIDVRYNRLKDADSLKAKDSKGKDVVWGTNEGYLGDIYLFSPQKSADFPIQLPGDFLIQLPGKGGLITIPDKPGQTFEIPQAYLDYLREREARAEEQSEQFTLTFDTAGGSKISSITEDSGAMINLYHYLPTKEGYNFEGWYEDKALSKKVNILILDKDTTVYAKWEADKQPLFADASDWAIPELEKAYDAGLIPEILKGLDMTKSISREEFAELAVQLYETATGKTILVTGANPFTDTTNYQILKAYQVGITAGTSDTTFSPNVLITREQCATMLYRAIKAIAPNADYSTAGVPDFPDQAHIASWAAEGTKYMSKLGIILGDTQGYFMPRPLTADHRASGYGMAAREAAVLMAIRTFEKIK